MVQLLKANFKGILIVLGLLTSFALVWVVDVRRAHTKDELKDYIDSCERVKAAVVWDIKLQLDSVAKNNETLKKNEKYVKGLSHIGIQHYIDSLSKSGR
jgi:hypothetical protein